jgi:hypothetical protein
MRRALIGFGTPLGSYLAQNRCFSHCYTYRQALDGIASCTEAVIIAPADKRLGGSRLAPRAHALLARLKRAAGHIVLLSSIDVYASRGVPFDETAKPAGPAGKAWLPLFERELLSLDASASILRLPDIFGLPSAKGMMGSLFDKDAAKLNRVAIHQWYPAHRLEGDIAKAKELAAPIVNLVSEPVPMTAILREFFPGQLGEVKTPAPYSRIQTRYARGFGGRGAYIMSTSEILAEMSRYIRASGTGAQSLEANAGGRSSGSYAGGLYRQV